MAILAAGDIWSGVPLLEQLSWFSPEIVLILTMLAVMVAPLTVGRSPTTIGGFVAAGIAAAFLLLWQIWSEGMVAGGASGLTPNSASGMLIFDSVALFYKLLLLTFLAYVTYLWWVGSSETERDAPEFFILLLGSALGMALMVSTTNLLMMAIAIETASLPSYAIVGFDKRNPKAAEASLKYMVFGAICAAIMVYGISLIYGLTGSLEFGEAARSIYAQLQANPLLIGLALFCAFAGVAFKISAVPFHFWCPDAFEGARIEVTTWLSVVSKGAGLILLIRLVQTFAQSLATSADAQGAGEAIAAAEFFAPIAWAVGVVACITCTWANFAAYLQTSAKRMLAYSSIAHAGYMLMAAAVIIHPQALQAGDIPSAYTGAAPGVSALLAYLTIYLFMNLTAFGVVAMMVWHTGSDSIEGFRGLFRRAPLLALPMTMALISLVGLPVFAGFFGKYWILMALGALQSSTGAGYAGALGWTLIVVACFNTLFSLFYYMRIIIEMSLKDDEALEPVQSPFIGTALANLSAWMLVALFIFGGPLKRMTDRLASRMYDPAAAIRYDAEEDVGSAAASAASATQSGSGSKGTN